MSKAGRIHKYPFYFIAPALAVYLTIVVWPSVQGFYFSLTDWSIFAPDDIQFIGFDNFANLFQEPMLKQALGNTLLFAFVVTVLQNVFGLSLALVLNQKLKLRNVLRATFFLPVVIAPLIVGYIFTAIYNPEVGLLNECLRAIGLGALAQDWLNDPKYSLYSVMATEVWRVTGFGMVIYIAGLQLIPGELIEAAKIDGAGYWSRLKNVVFPLLSASFTVNFLLSVIGTLKVFEIVLVLTRGGPGYETEVFNTMIYRSFANGDYGYATAMNVILFVLITLLGLCALYVLRKREVEM